MKNFINKIINNKILTILGVLIIATLILLFSKTTYSYVVPENIDELDYKIDNAYKMITGDAIKLDVNENTLSESGKNVVASSTSKVLLKSQSDSHNYYFYFDIPENEFLYSSENVPEIILTISGPNGEVTNIEGLTYGTFNGVSGFDVTTVSGLHEITSSVASTDASNFLTVHEWKVTLTYLNLPIDQSINIGKKLEVNFYLEDLPRGDSNE